MLKTHRYQIHLKPEEYEILRREAFKRRGPISVLIRHAIGTWLIGQRRTQRGACPWCLGTGKMRPTGKVKLKK